MSVKLFSDFKNDDVFFHAPTFNIKGQKNVDLSYDKDSVSYNKRILLQLCRDKNPIISKWRLSEPREGDDGKRRNWELLVHDESLLKVLKDFDNYILDYAVTHSREWFKKELNKDQVEARFKPIVKDPKEGENTNSIIIKVSCPPGDYPTPIMKLNDTDSLTKGSFFNLQKGTIDDLTKDAEVVPVVRISGVWFMSDSFGVSLSAHKMIVKPAIKKEFKDHFILENSYDYEKDAEEENNKKTDEQDISDM